MVLRAAVPAVLVPAEQVVGDQTPTDVAVPVPVVRAVQLAVATLRVPVAPEAAPRVTALRVLAIPGKPAVGMIAAATSPVMRGSPETIALGRDVMTAPARAATTGPVRDVTTAPGREVKIAPVRVVMTGPVRAAMTGPVRDVMTAPVRAATTGPVRVAMTAPVRVVTIGQLPVVMTDQLHAGMTATYRVGGGMDGRLRAGRTARQKTGSRRCGMTRATAVLRVARVRRPVAPAVMTEASPIVAPAATTVALPIVCRVATTGVRLSALLVGMPEVPLTAGRDVMIGPRLGAMIGRRLGVTTSLGRDVTIGPGLGVTIGPGLAGTTAQGHAETTGVGRVGATGVGRDVMTGPDRRVRLGVGGGRIAAHVVAIALRGRFGSAGLAVTRTRPARAVTIRRSPQVSPAPSSTVRSKPNCARCRGASLTWSRSTWSPRVG